MNIYKIEKKDHSGNIYVAACSMPEAIDAIISLNINAPIIYDFKKFNFFSIPNDKYGKILHLDETYWAVPRFISKNEFDLLQKYSHFDTNNKQIIRKEIDKSIGEKFIDAADIANVIKQLKQNIQKGEE